MHNAEQALLSPMAARPSALERTFNRTIGWLAGLGWTSADYVQLEVPGRRTGKLHRTPVNLLRYEGRCFLVAPRGRTQWVLNASAAGEVTLKHGRRKRRYQVQAVALERRAPLLAAYLQRYVSTVQRFFTVPAGSELGAFAAIAGDHPVFELIAR
ncbi:MAG: nitroreductase family deazaflavin-dependent oxidoreductase [Myxococcales bacterium]|nr:nitroreductase family deazaflavin-dependent oxidoreductase [Myxococcales bacterium]MDD9967557.1 nitroreductase family deazaflavin-dependent oxidoreductase [Myxococcales bacterium]